MEKLKNVLIIIFTILFAILFTYLISFSMGCAIVPVETVQGRYEVPKLDSIPKIIDWINYNIKYKSDTELYGVKEYWASPSETLINRAGDCEDFAILFLVMVYENLGNKGTLITLINKDRKGHALGEVSLYRYYEVEGYDRVYVNYTYDEMLRMIGHTSDRAVKDDIIMGGDSDYR